nr:Zinc finger protein-related, putative [Ipomoea batatas]
MSEKCLMMSSLAILACHPSSTIRCFKPRPSVVVSPKREKPDSEDYEENPKLPHESLDSHAKRVFSLPRLKEVSVPFELLEEVVEGEALLGVVEAVFRAGWKCNGGAYTIRKVFRVNPESGVYEMFEAYRKAVKAKGGLWGDGNEVLRYRGTAITCSLGFSQFMSTCNRRSCGVCRIIGRHNSNNNNAAMDMRPVTLSKTSWRAHRRAEKCRGGRDDNKRAIVVCRVIAGRVARCCNGSIVNGEEDGEFDSVENMDASEKLMVLDSRAILPCFVVLYNVL